LKIERIAVQLGVFALAIVLGSFIGVAIYTDLHVVNPLQQTAAIIVTDFIVYLAVIKVAPVSRPAAGE
jgi:hypothetical protein